MSFCIIKATILYFLLVSMVLYIKPAQFYYDTNKTKLKPWNLFLHTKNIHDCNNLFVVIIIIAILSVIISR
jgi:hypothetical protein